MIRRKLAGIALMSSVMLFSACNNQTADNAAAVKDSVATEVVTPKDTSTTMPAPNYPIIAIFDCGTGSTAKVTFTENKAHITGTLNGQNIDVDLPQVESGSGARYSNGKQQIWNKGNNLAVDLGDGKNIDCVAQPK